MHLLVAIVLLGGCLGQFIDSTPDCPGNGTTRILRMHFKDRHCLSFVEIKTAVQISRMDWIYHSVDLPRMVQVKPPLNRSDSLTYRPKRDDFLTDGILWNYCQENYVGIIVLTRNLYDLHGYFMNNGMNAFLSTQSLFFIFLTEDHCGEVEPVFQKLWNIYRVPNVVIAGCHCDGVQFYDPTQRPNGKLYTYNDDEIVANAQLIRNDMKNNHGYPFKAVLFLSLMAYPIMNGKKLVDFGGADAEMLNLICSSLNLTKEVMLPLDGETYGVRLPNGTSTGAMHLLLEGAADMAAVGFFVKDYFSKDVEFSASAVKDELCLVAHKAQKIPQWQTLYYYFDARIWFAMAALVVLLGLVWTGVQRAEQRLGAHVPPYAHVFTDTVRVMLSTSAMREPPLPAEKLFLALVMLAFTTFTGTFQGSLVTVFSNPLYYPDLDSLEQVADARLPILTRYASFRDEVFSDESSRTLQRLRQLMRVERPRKEINRIVVESGAVAGLTRRSSMDLENKTRFEDARGVNQLHLVRECVCVYMLAYMVPRRSAFAPRINDIILRAAHAGLFGKWYSDMAANVTLRVVSNRRRSNDTQWETDERKKFSLTDMQIAFIELGIGLLISVLVFLGELAHGCCRHAATMSSKK